MRAGYRVEKINWKESLKAGSCKSIMMKRLRKDLQILRKKNSTMPFTISIRLIFRKEAMFYALFPNCSITGRLRQDMSWRRFWQKAGLKHGLSTLKEPMNYWDRSKMMLPEYQFSEADTLSRQFIALDSSIHQNQCEKIFRDYNELMSEVNDAKQNNEFIKALKLAIDAVNLSMDHLNCRIRDDNAWYQKIILELPA